MILVDSLNKNRVCTSDANK